MTTLTHAAALALVGEKHPELNDLVETDPTSCLEIARLTVERFPATDVEAELTRRLRVAREHGALHPLDVFRQERA